MNESERQQKTSPDDIDLLLLVERFILFFKKYKWVFVIAAFSGLVAGYLFYRSLPNIYKSRLIVHSFLLTNQEQIKIIENWNALLRKSEYSELAATFNCPQDILPKVKKISAEEIQKVFSAINPNGFVIDVNVTNNSILENLQRALVFGLENSVYVKERLRSKRINLKELIDKTSIETLKLDSTKKAIEDIIEGKGRSSSTLIIEGATINKQLIEMNEKLIGYKDELKFTSSVQVLQGFSKFSKPTGPHLIPWLVIGLLVFLPLGFLFALVSSINGKIRNRMRASRQAIQDKNV